MKSVLTDEQAHHTRRLKEANEKVIASIAILELRVIAARQSGVMSWAQIGNALDVARQSAQERFQKLPELAEWP
jgi:hypothetical protein